MEAFLVSAGIVALAEIGDKTQLLAVMLAARYQRPWPIVLGIFTATIFNHALAGAVGAWLTSVVRPDTLRWILGVSFLAMAAWVLIPDKPGSEAGLRQRFGVFGTTIVTFFLAEMGDKTQIATVALTARFHAFAPVVVGTTLGMLLANVPAVLLADRFAERLPMRVVHAIAAGLFAILGMLALLPSMK